MDANREMLNAYTHARDKTIELVEFIPEDWLSRKAEGEQHALGRVLQHIAGGEAWWMHRVMNDKGGMINEANILPKADIIRLLKETRDRTIAFFSKKGAMEKAYDYPRPDGQIRPLTGSWCLLYLLQHEVHHRGKIVLALRQWGAKGLPFIPYSGWQ